MGTCLFLRFAHGVQGFRFIVQTARAADFFIPGNYRGWETMGCDPAYSCNKIPVDGALEGFGRPP